MLNKPLAQKSTSRAKSGKVILFSKYYIYILLAKKRIPCELEQKAICSLNPICSVIRGHIVFSV